MRLNLLSLKNQDMNSLKNRGKLFVFFLNQQKILFLQTNRILTFPLNQEGSLYNPQPHAFVTTQANGTLQTGAFSLPTCDFY